MEDTSKSSDVVLRVNEPRASRSAAAAARAELYSDRDDSDLEGNMNGEDYQDSGADKSRVLRFWRRKSKYLQDIKGNDAKKIEGESADAPEGSADAPKTTEIPPAESSPAKTSSSQQDDAKKAIMRRTLAPLRQQPPRRMPSCRTLTSSLLTSGISSKINDPLYICFVRIKANEARSCRSSSASMPIWSRRGRGRLSLRSFKVRKIVHLREDTLDLPSTI
jgi:hypothetical protein